jgi:putative ABC transport system permease protein
MGGLVTDLRHARRRMASRPLTSLLAVGMLALAVGIATAMFTLVDALLLRPVPFPDADRLARIAMRTDHSVFGAVSPAVLRAWRDSGMFAAVEGTHKVTSVLETASRTVGRDTAFVTPGMLRVVGARPVLGRLFDEVEGRGGVEEIVLVAERLWRNALGGDRAILGSRIRIDGRPVVIVGVLPDTFRFPAWNTEIWRPIDYDALPASLAGSRPIAHVKFALEIPEGDALRRAAHLAISLEPNIGRGDGNVRASRWPLAGLSTSSYLSQATPFLAGGVVLVFLVLCANVCSLLLAQLGARAGEFGICAALGASRARLLRQAGTEALLLGGAGIVVGVGAAWLLLAAARSWLPESFLMQTLNPIDLDPRALLAASASGVAAILVAGLVPAWIGTRLGAAESARLRAESRGATESRLGRRFTRGLVVSEIALSCTLLLGTALLVTSFVRLASVERGLDAKGVVTAWLATRPAPEGGSAGLATPAAAIDAAIRTLPGVVKVVVSESTPPEGGDLHFGSRWLPDTPGANALDLGAVSDFSVSREFFDLYRIRLVRGRSFEAGEDPSHVVVGEQFALLMWPGLEPTGRSFTFEKQRFEVVGVVNEIRYPSLEAGQDGPEFYRQSTPAGGQLRVSFRCDPVCPNLAIVRQKLLAVSDVRRIYTLGHLEDSYLGELSRPKAAAALATVFAGIGLLAAAGGLFSVLSYATARRRREFGIRASLGARPIELHRLVFAEGLRLALAGAALGGAAGWLLARALTSVLYQVTMADPAIWAAVFLLIALTTVLASWLPARRAAGVNPVELLRERS